jgi:hypothetical protein
MKKTPKIEFMKNGISNLSWPFKKWTMKSMSKFSMARIELKMKKKITRP